MIGPDHSQDYIKIYLLKWHSNFLCSLLKTSSKTSLSLILKKIAVQYHSLVLHSSSHSNQPKTKHSLNINFYPNSAEHYCEDKRTIRTSYISIFCYQNILIAVSMWNTTIHSFLFLIIIDTHAHTYTSHQIKQKRNRGHKLYVKTMKREELKRGNIWIFLSLGTMGKKYTLE